MHACIYMRSRNPCLISCWNCARNIGQLVCMFIWSSTYICIYIYIFVWAMITPCESPNAYLDSFFCGSPSLTHSMADSLNDWLNEWMTHSINGWLSDSLAQWLTHWLNHSLTHWITESLAQWVTNWLNHPMTWPMTGSLTQSLNDWLTNSLSQWLTHSLNDWLTDSLAHWRLPEDVTSSIVCCVSIGLWDPTSITTVVLFGIHKYTLLDERTDKVIVPVSLRSKNNIWIMKGDFNHLSSQIISCDFLILAPNNPFIERTERDPSTSPLLHLQMP